MPDPGAQERSLRDGADRAGLFARAVVHGQREGALEAEERLLRLLVRMCAADRVFGHILDYVETAHRERHLRSRFADGKRSAFVLKRFEHDAVRIFRVSFHG